MQPLDSELRRITRALAELGHVLAAADGISDRLQRALQLLHQLVPYRRASLLARLPQEEHELFTVPEQSAAESAATKADLVRLLRELSNEEELEVAGRGNAHLTMPLLGLEELVGLVRVEAEDGATYDATHLRLLSVVAAQLGSYIAMIRLHGELAAAHAFQQRLVGIASHDLRNPLTVMAAVTSTLLKKTNEPKRAEALDRALRSVKRANRLINDLLDVTHSRVSGGLGVSPSRVDVGRVVQEALDDVRDAHPQRELRFVPPREGALPADWDADRMIQVVTNLVNNALTHGDGSSPVSVSLERERDDVVLAVHNRGPAIAPELKRALFDPFKRKHAVRSAGAGLGLGLYIVDQIVRSHGGSVTVRSTDADGTTFEVRTPVVRQRASGPAAGVERSGLVLIVDDEPDARQALADILEQHGYRVATAADGSQALRQLRSGLQPDLVLLDIAMPVMDGEAFYEACRSDPQLASIPVFAISADAAAAAALHQRGAAGYLSKPVDADALLRAVGAGSGE